MRNPDERRGDLRAQLAAHRLAERRLDELCERRGQETVEAAMDELHDYSERLRPSGDRAAAGRPLRGRRRARAGGRWRARAPRRGHDRRRRARDRLRRHGGPARREPELPARRHALGLLLRRPLPDRPGRARLGRRLRAGARDARPRARSSTPARRRRSRPGTSRPRAGSSTSSSPPSARRWPCPRRARGR